MRLGRRALLRVLGMLGVAGGASLPGGAGAHEAEDADETGVRLLASGSPIAAPGQVLSLFRFTVPPGYVFEQHRHPGLTLLAIERGAMEWTLREGSAEIRRAGDGRRVLLGLGETVILAPGDSIAYDRETVHTAAAGDDGNLTVISTTLLDAAGPATIAVD